ncbi:MAG: hypothetical protein WB646_08825 [Steroidobacteraceae bacterium]
MNHFAIVLLCAGLGLAGVALAEDAAPNADPDAPVTAYWAEHEEVDELGKLPRAYGCDDLFYKYRDILLKLGVRPGIKIYTYGCTRPGQPASGTTKVDLTYDLPHPAPTGFKAYHRSVTLTAGDPKSLTVDDCALLDDMRQTVIAAISNQVDAHGLDCGSGHHHKKFKLTVQTLVAAETQTQ